MRQVLAENAGLRVALSEARRAIAEAPLSAGAACLPPLTDGLQSCCVQDFFSPYKQVVQLKQQTARMVT